MAGQSISQSSIEGFEVPPVSSAERLFRRILNWKKGRDPNVKIPQRFFMPRPWVSAQKPGDSSGLSVSRAMLTRLEDIAKPPKAGDQTHVAQLGVADVRAIELTVVPDPGPTDIGHSLIPELNSISRLDPEQEQKMDEWAMFLRDRASLVDLSSLNQSITESRTPADRKV